MDPAEASPRPIRAVARCHRRVARLALAMVFVACAPAAGDEDGETGSLGEVSFARDVAPIFARKCVWCHYPGNAVKVDLTQPFDPEVGIIDRPNSWTDSEYAFLVVPGDPDASALIAKVEREDFDPKVDGAPMPLHLPRLTAQEVDDLRAWIDAGAQDDALYADRITRIFGDGVSLGSTSGKCAYCHAPGGLVGPDLTRPFDPAVGIVGAPSAYGGQIVAPGDAEASVLFRKVNEVDLPIELGAPMPLHPERLSDEEAQTLRRWIAEGASAN